MCLKEVECKSREATQPAWTPGSSKPERRLASLDDADKVKSAADIRYDGKVKDKKEAGERKEVYAAPNYRNYLKRLIATNLRSLGVDVKVAQELLRHANSRTTMDLYTQAVSADKRDASKRQVELLLA